MIPILSLAVDSMVPVNAVTLIIGAVASAIALVIGKRQGRQEVVESRTVEIEGQPGTFLDDRLTIACGSGAIRLLKLQREGKGAMEADDFLRGFPIPQGTEAA